MTRNQDGFPGFPGGFPGGTPGGFPGGTPGGFPGGFPGGQFAPPTAPPPSFTPQISSFQQQEFRRRGGSAGIRRCLFRNTFIVLVNGNSFWFFPIFIQGNQVVGFRWRGRRGWEFDTINRNRIVFFQCY